MLKPQDVQLTDRVFLDPVVQEEYKIGYLTASNRPVMARLIPQSGTSATWITESTIYNDTKSRALMSSYGYVQKPDESLILLMEPALYNLASDIEERKRQGKKYEIIEIVEILESCLEGLGAIYRLPQGPKVHGNLTPSSVFKSADGSYKLGNFCSAMASSRSSSEQYAAYICTRVIQYWGMQQPWQVDYFDLGILLLHLCELNEPLDLLALGQYGRYAQMEQHKDRFSRVPKEYQNELLVELFCYLMQTDQMQKEQGFDAIAEMLLKIKTKLTGRKLIKASIQYFRSSTQPAQVPASYSLQASIARDPPKEDRKEWLCTSCTTAIASGFCTCGGKETFLCDSCYPAHFTKYLRAVHFVIPITAYGLHKTPGYFERIQSRSINFPIAVSEVLKNIEEIDKSIEKVSSEIQSVLTAIYEYGTKVVSELQLLKSELEKEINDSIAEVENTMHEDSPALRSTIAKAIREFNGDLQSLQFFTFSVNINKIMEEIESICSYAAIRPNENEYSLPGIQGNQLMIFHIQKAKYSSVELPLTFMQGKKLCNIGSNSVLIVGSTPAASDAFTVNISNGDLLVIPQMHTPRSCPGLITVNQFAFVFGGNCDACEKYDTLKEVWIDLPKMSKARSSFSPCRYQHEIYLIDATNCIETFHLNSERFRELQVNPSGLSGYLLCVCKDGEFIIVTNSYQVGKWKPGSASIQVTRINHSNATSQCSPVIFQDEVYFVDESNGVLHSYNTKTETISRK